MQTTSTKSERLEENKTTSVTLKSFGITSISTLKWSTTLSRASQITIHPKPTLVNLFKTMKLLLSASDKSNHRHIFYGNGENQYFEDAHSNRQSDPGAYAEMVEQTGATISQEEQLPDVDSVAELRELCRQKTETVLSDNSHKVAPHAWSHKRR